MTNQNPVDPSESAADGLESGDSDINSINAQIDAANDATLDATQQMNEVETDINTATTVISGAGKVIKLAGA
jgi:hypothetical protein